ncbi:hypothetical protein [Candidatus Pantoea floridensis]|uniref:Uncharacterized protein n=1 Tax=Candidatus Pantoea floridensis TaxID=1938870 RepID=A0A286BZY1_9GAMM|nr:hypothetical protein [Pantoea floridensis]PIF22193.1 hypothetical protein BX596_1602 [Enterobacteriaceae bacterium JKS000233]PXW18523.1 hypothetical protein BY447_0076 [Pantoea sp. JKS000250]SOD39700.1 hypothetical protein SAMN06273570_4154 [Pantoea floridensis]
MRSYRLLDDFKLVKDYETTEEITKNIELNKFMLGLIFSSLSLPYQMKYIGVLEELGGDFKEMAEYLRKFKQEKDATETVLKN